MTQPKTPAKRPSLRQKVDAARKKTPIFKSPEFVEDSDEETAVEKPAERSEETVQEVAEEEQVAGTEEGPPVEEEPAEIEKLKNAAFVWIYKRRGDTQSSTHSSMIGGSFVVPLDQRKIFLLEYFNVFVRWLTSPITPPTLFLTERYNDEYFRFFVDIDYEWDASPSPILDTINTVTRAVRHVLGYLDGNSYNCLLEERTSGRTAYKLHLVFPQVITSPSNVLLFAQAVEKQANSNAVDLLIATREEFPLKFDHQVYIKGSLRLLGSCKKNGLAPQHENETEFFYMPIDSSGERTKTITYEEFARHSILLDKETHDRVAQSMESGDGVVFLPKDETYGEDLFVTSKYIPSGNVHRIRPEMVIYSAYTGSGQVSAGSDMYQCIQENFGAEIATASTLSRISHDPEKNCSYIPLSTMRQCPFYGQEHCSQNLYIVLSQYGIRLKCHSNKRDCCAKGNIMVKRAMLPPGAIVELPASKPEILEDVCGGGESICGDEEFDTPHPGTLRPKSSLPLDDILLSAAVDGTHVSLAKFFVRRFKGKYMAAQGKDQKNLTWFAFEQPVWKTNLAYSMLIIDIVDSIPEFKELADRLKREEKEEQERVKAAGKGGEVVERSHDVFATVKKLETNAFKGDICKEMSHMVSLTLDNSTTDLPFVDRLNVYGNKHLLAFKNGVYDLQAHIFRDGKPDDYFSYTTGYNFSPDPDVKKLDALRKHYEQVQPDPITREYLLKTMSSTLDGEVKEQKVFVWYGAKGEGGKSTTADMHVGTLGGFARKINSSYFVQEQQSSENVTNTLNLIQGRRLAVAEEFKQGATLNDAVCKQVTATTNVVRDHHSQQKNVDNTTTVFAHTNHELRSHSGDQAINRRIEHVMFNGRFVDHPDPENPREFKKDKTFTANFLADDAWKLANFHILLDHYKLYQEKGLEPIPESVSNFRERFEALSNPVGVWLKGAVVRKPGTNAGFAEMRRLYSIWYQESYNIEANTKNFMDSLQQNSLVVEILGKKSCTMWTSEYDVKTRTTTRIRKKVSTRPAVLDVELVDVEADIGTGSGL